MKYLLILILTLILTNVCFAGPYYILTKQNDNKILLINTDIENWLNKNNELMLYDMKLYNKSENNYQTPYIYNDNFQIPYTYNDIFKIYNNLKIYNKLKK